MWFRCFAISEIRMSVVDITAEDPFVKPTREFLQDPYACYDELRSKGKFLWSSAGEERWITFSYDTAVTVLNDKRFSVNTPEKQLDQFGEFTNDAAYSDLLTGLTKFMLAQDPPQHTRIRKLANKAFTRSEVSDMTARIGNIVDELIDKVASSGKMDLIADFAFPLPITIICDVLGIPASEHDRLRDWTNNIAFALEPVLDVSTLPASAKAATELFEYLKVLIADRKKHPTNDLLSAFVQAEEEGDCLNLEELLSNMLLLIIAGHDTTVNLIGNGMLSLLKNPEGMNKLKAQPELLPVAIEEFLRYQSPLQLAERFALEDMKLEGQDLKKGDRVSVILGGANRDPSQFESPSVLNIERQPNKHLAFGQGIHFCLGAPLARFEAKIAFEKLLGRLSNITLKLEEPEFKDSTTFRGLKHLPLEFQAN